KETSRGMAVFLADSYVSDGVLLRIPASAVPSSDRARTRDSDRLHLLGNRIKKTQPQRTLRFTEEFINHQGHQGSPTNIPLPSCDFVSLVGKALKPSANLNASVVQGF